MARFLFVSWGGAGNQTPVFGLAAALAARGHDITVAGYPEQRDRFELLGFEFRTLPRAQHAWPATPPDDWIPALVDAVWACPAHLEDIPGLMGGERYDLMVIDCLMFAALAAAETAGIPAVALVHGAPGALAPPGGGLDQLALPRVNEVRASAGLTPLPTLWDAWRPFTTLVTSVPDLDPHNGGLPDEFAFAGPVFEPPREPKWTSPWAPHDHRPLVVASFSTGQAWDQSSRIRRTRDALADGRRRVLITTGPFTVDSTPGRPGVSLVPYVPHHAVLPEASVVITHAGHGTVAAALSHGVPMVCLPNLAADQPAPAHRVAELGAGIVLDGDAATPAEIAGAVRTVLGDTAYRDKARHLAEAIRAAPGAEGIASRLTDLVAAK